MAIVLTSAVVGEGEFLPSRYTGDGQGVSPPLEWDRVPSETRSFSVLLEGISPEGEVTTQWLVFDLPAGTRSLPESAPGIGRNARNDLQTLGYAAPSPAPQRGDHRYRFVVSALDVDTLGLPAGARRPEVEEAMRGHVLDRGTLQVRYRRGRAG